MPETAENSPPTIDDPLALLLAAAEAVLSAWKNPLSGLQPGTLSIEWSMARLQQAVQLVKGDAE